jgi:hypothetical protein
MTTRGSHTPWASLWMTPIALERQKNERFPGVRSYPGFPQTLTTRKLMG